MGWMFDNSERKAYSKDPIESDHAYGLDRYGKDDGYYVFFPKEQEKEIRSVVFFVHGYGALNPMIFGEWLEHLIKNGNIVIYPRYQKNLISPATTKFTPNAAEALKGALKDIKGAGIQLESLPLVFFGHSFGGVIVSNLAAQADEYDVPTPDVVMVAEGGTGPFTGALIEDYGVIPSDIPFLVTVGDNDWTVGSYFGERLFKEVPKDNDLVLLHQKSFYQEGKWSITASHYEPYAMNDWCDNKNYNFTFKRAQQVAKTDVLDEEGYWHWLDLCIERARGELDSWEADMIMEGLHMALGENARRVVDVYKKSTYVTSRVTEDL